MDILWGILAGLGIFCLWLLAALWAMGKVANRKRDLTTKRPPR